MSEYLEKSAGRGYVERSKVEFDAILVKRLKFQVAPPSDDVHEIVYERLSHDGRFKVVVYSSLQKGLDRTRDCGSDAIRVLMVDMKSGRPRKIMGEGKNAKTGTRINRTKGAMTNLERRVKQYLYMGTKQYTCPVCAGLMAVRKRKSDGKKFLSCTERNEDGEWCSGKRSVPVWA